MVTDILKLVRRSTLIVMKLRTELEDYTDQHDISALIRTFQCRGVCCHGASKNLHKESEDVGCDEDIGIYVAVLSQQVAMQRSVYLHHLADRRLYWGPRRMMRRAKITKTAATSGDGEAMSATVLHSDVSDLVG